MTRQGWGVTKIALVLYPFGVGAVAVNLFFAGLIASWLGLPIIPPVWSVIGGVILGVPVTWIFARHIRTLMDRADDGGHDINP
jgi:hypothetical protein